MTTLITVYSSITLLYPYDNPSTLQNHFVAPVFETVHILINMSKPFDYSKWDKIELSDDEDDVHPNIDRESWFRMKHRSRVEREEHEEKDKKRIIEEVRDACVLMVCVPRIYC